MFKLEDIVLEFTDDAIDCVAKEALEKDIGARGLRSYLKKYCCNYNMNWPVQKAQDVEKIIINDAVIIKRSTPNVDV